MYIYIHLSIHLYVYMYTYTYIYVYIYIYSMCSSVHRPRRSRNGLLRRRPRRHGNWLAAAAAAAAATARTLMQRRLNRRWWLKDFEGVASHHHHHHHHHLHHHHRHHHLGLGRAKSQTATHICRFPKPNTISNFKIPNYEIIHIVLLCCCCLCCWCWSKCILLVCLNHYIFSYHYMHDDGAIHAIQPDCRSRHSKPIAKTKVPVTSAPTPP